MYKTSHHEVLLINLLMVICCIAVFGLVVDYLPQNRNVVVQSMSMVLNYTYTIYLVCVFLYNHNIRSDTFIFKNIIKMQI